MLFLTNGKVWTGDAARPLADSVTIDGNRISALSQPATRNSQQVIDLRGRLAMPGFIDNHVHFIEGALQLSRVQLRDAATAQEFARRIGEHARKIGSGKWITGGSWDHTLWSPQSLPTRQLIDDLTPDNPVFVSRLDIHMALANSLALRLAGITRDTEDPPGGTIVRYADGEPTGILKDTAQAFVQRVIPQSSHDERAAAIRAGLAEAARFGVTAFCDMLNDGSVYEGLDLTARVTCFAPIFESLGTAAGVKGFADGSLGSATAAFFEPYSDDANNRGLTVAPLDPLAGVAAATGRGVTFDEALRCYTVNNAYAMFREHEIGRIAPGMLADVVVLSEDNTQVDFTIFNGQTVYERRL